MTSTYTQMHAHTDTNTLQSKLRLQIGWRGTQEGSWWWLKWKSWTDQYCWRFSSLNSPLNCHAHSKQLKALCLCTFTPPPFFSFTSPFSLALSSAFFKMCHCSFASFSGSVFQSDCHCVFSVTCTALYFTNKKLRSYFLTNFQVFHSVLYYHT